MKIILSTRKLPEYESFLKPSSSSSSNKEQILTTRPRDYTIQLPPKKSRSRTHKQRKSKKSRDEEKEEGQLDDEPSKISKEGNKSGDAAVAGIVQDQQGNIKSSNLQGSASLEVQTEQLPANPLKSPAPQSKKRKADAIESQSSEATQKSSQM